jgi:uncharacterized protein (DUF1501 family)
MKQINRRTFLSNSTCAIASASALAGWFAPKLRGATAAQNYRALVCIYLAGGNDGHQMVIPIKTSRGDSGNQGYADYAAVRPVAGIGLTQSSLLPIMSGSDQYGLHPSLVNIRQLYATNKAAILANVGNLEQPTTSDFYRSHYLLNDGSLPQDLLSHNLQEFQWSSGMPIDGATTGWAGRIADLSVATNQSPLPMTILGAGSPSLFGIGTVASPGSLSIGGGLNPVYEAATTQLLQIGGGVSLAQACNAMTSTGISQQNAMTEAVRSLSPATNQAINNRFQGLGGGLAAQLQTIAQVISASVNLGITQQIFMVTQGSYDTHGNERGWGQQDMLLAALDGAVNAFYLSTQDLGLAQNVTAFTTSEFGRNLIVNTNNGTDHAWGNHHFIIGGSVNGGKMYGTFPTLRVYGPDDVSNGPNTPGGIIIASTSIVEYSATLARWFGVANGDLIKVFPTLKSFPAFNSNIGIGFL